MTKTQYDGADRREPERWKVKKEISVVDIITIVTAIVSILYAFNSLDKRVTVIETVTVAQVAVDKKQDEESFRYQGRIDQALAAMNLKLDRLLERPR